MMTRWMLEKNSRSVVTTLIVQSIFTIGYAQTTIAGFWTNSSSGKCSHAPLAGRAAGLGIYARPSDWLSQSCPIESLEYSCYFLGDITRAKLLEERVWVSSDGQCLDFNPTSFLQSIQGRRIFLFGDSMMSQIFYSLVCALLPFQQDIRLKYAWLEWEMQEDDKKVCLYGFEHCHIRFQDPYDAIVESTSLDLLIFHQMSHNRREKFFDALKIMQFETSDIMIFNFGLWDSDEKAYGRLLTAILDELKLVKINQSVVLPSIFFLESTPQHFSTPNGYFDSAVHGQPCGPFADAATAKQSDWRNMQARAIFGNHDENLGLRIIPIAEPLYDRWDAHIGNISTYGQNDCTHWCNPSGVLSFIHHRIHSAIASTALPPAPALGSAERYGNAVRNHFIPNQHLLAHLKHYENLIEMTLSAVDKRTYLVYSDKLYLLPDAKTVDFVQSRLRSFNVSIEIIQLDADKNRDQVSERLNTINANASRVGLPFLSTQLFLLDSDRKLMLKCEERSPADVYAIVSPGGDKYDKALIPTLDLFHRMGGNGTVAVETVPQCQLDLINERLFRAEDFVLAPTVPGPDPQAALKDSNTLAGSMRHSERESRDPGEPHDKAKHQQRLEQKKSPRFRNSALDSRQTMP